MSEAGRTATRIAVPLAARPRRWLGASASFEAYLFLLPLLLIVIGLAGYPLINGILLSMTNRTVTQPGEFIGLQNFAQLFTDPVYAVAVGNSVLLTAGIVAAKLVLGLAAASLLTQAFPLRGLVRSLAFLPWAVPGLVAVLGWRWMLDEQSGIINAMLRMTGLVNQPVDWLSDPEIALFSIAAVSVWQGLPFFIMMFVGGMMSIPEELYEAAAIDGAGAWSSFFNVTVPSIFDVIAITVMLSLIWTFNAFQTVYLLTGGGPADRTQILPTLAYKYSLQTGELGLGAAVIVSFAPIFAGMIVLLTRRMLRERGAR